MQEAINNSQEIMEAIISQMMTIQVYCEKEKFIVVASL